MRKLISAIAFAALSALSFAAYAVPTVTLTATPASGISPVSVVLDWSSTGATGCTASGSWTGAKAVSGTQTITDVRANATYTLTCTEGAGSAVLTWTAPTLNTDGSALTNLAGFKVYAATTAAGVAAATPVVISNPATRTYTYPSLAAGAWYFGAKAFNSAGVDSAMSGVPTKTVVLASASASASVAVSTQPQPPVVTIATTAKLLKPDGTLGRDAGYVALNTPCGALAVDTRRKGDWYLIPREAVQLNKYGRQSSNPTVAKCAAAS